jgi:hypothetical protein
MPVTEQRCWADLQMENIPPPKPGREPKVVPKEMQHEILQNHAEALRNFSRSYLTIVIEFSSHSQLLADRNFFRWMHTMLCQFIEQSIEKGDQNLEEAVQLEIHRLFQGDRFNVEAKKPEQIQRVYHRPIRKWALNRECALTLGKEMQRNSPVVTTVLPSPSQRIQSMLKDLDDSAKSAFSRQGRGRHHRNARSQQHTQGSRGDGTRPASAVPFSASRKSPGCVALHEKHLPARPQTSHGFQSASGSPSSPDWVFATMAKLEVQSLAPLLRFVR